MSDSKLGSVAASFSNQAKHHQIRKIVFTPQGNCVIFRLETDSSKEQVNYLTHAGALELAKGLLKRLPALYPAADDELMSLFRMWKSVEKETGEAIAEALSTV